MRSRHLRLQASVSVLAAPTLVLLAEGVEKDIDELMAGIARSWSSKWCSGDHFTMLAQLVRGHEKWMTEAREVRAAGGCLAPLLGASKKVRALGSAWLFRAAS